MLDESAVPVRLTHMWRGHSDDVVVVSDANFNLLRYEFNRVGGRVWELMDGRKSLKTIVDEITAENPGVPRHLIASSVNEFVEHLQSEWLMMSTEELASYE